MRKYKRDHELLVKLLGALRKGDVSDDLIDLIRKDVPNSELEAHIDEFSTLEGSRPHTGQSSLDNDADEQSSSSASGESSQWALLQSPGNHAHQVSSSTSSTPAGSNEEARKPTQAATTWRGIAIPQEDMQCQYDDAVSGNKSLEDPYGQARPLEKGTFTEDAVADDYVAPGAVRSFRNLAMSHAILANRYPPDVQARQLGVIFGQLETCIPLNHGSVINGVASAAAGAVRGFIDVARSQIALGVPAQTVLSMDGFDLDLFYRDKTPSDPHTIANWAAEFGRGWDSVPLASRFAAIRYIGSLVRWLTMPCKETYQMMSPVVRPKLCQLMIPHTLDVDLWGAPSYMRELQLLHNGRWFNHVTEDMQQLLWPHATEAITEKILVASNVGEQGVVYQGEGRYLKTVERLSPLFTSFIDKDES